MRKNFRSSYWMKFHLRLQQFNNQNVDFDPLLKICKIVKIYYIIKWSLFAECFNFYIYYPKISGSKLNLLVRDGFKQKYHLDNDIHLSLCRHYSLRFSCSFHHVENLRHWRCLVISSKMLLQRARILNLDIEWNFTHRSVQRYNQDWRIHSSSENWKILDIF